MIAVTDSITSVNVDMLAIAQRVSGDFVMFAIAMLAYYTVHHVKAKATARIKLSKDMKLSKDRYDEQDSARESTDYVTGNQTRTAAATVQVEAVKIFPTESLKPTTRQEDKIDICDQLAKMKRHAAERNIRDTLRVFHSVRQSTGVVTSDMYNTVLQAWVRCGNVWQAESYLDEIKEAGMANEESFVILAKALVKIRDLDKARALLQGMREAGLSPSITIFDELLLGFSNCGFFNDAIALLDEMTTAGVQPSTLTPSIVAKLADGATKVNQKLSVMNRVMANYGPSTDTKTSPSPCMTTTLSQCEKATSAGYVHNIEVNGSLLEVRKLQRTLKQLGFLEKAESNSLPLNGHWQTDIGDVVVIERKTVRWSQERASRLRFTSTDCSKCTLTFDGKFRAANMLPPMMAGSTKALKWDTGEVWHAFEGRSIYKSMLYSQSMTKPRRDRVQDEASSARTASILKAVSKQGIGMPTSVENTVLGYVGNGLYYIRIHFESTSNQAKVCDYVSRRHPRVGIRHCWGKARSGFCGQRALLNGDHVDNECYTRHIGAVCIR